MRKPRTLRGIEESEKADYETLENDYRKTKSDCISYLDKYFDPLIKYINAEAVGISDEATEFIIEAGNSIRHCQLRENDDGFFDTVDEAVYHIWKYAGISELYEVCFYVSDHFDELQEILRKAGKSLNGRRNR